MCYPCVTVVTLVAMATQYLVTMVAMVTCVTIFTFVEISREQIFIDRITFYGSFLHDLLQLIGGAPIDCFVFAMVPF